MSKQKFQIGDKVALVKQPYTVGTVVMTCSKLYGYGEFAQFRKLYEVSFGDGLPNKYYLSYELKFADLHSLAEHAKKYEDVPLLSKKEKEEIQQKTHKEFHNGEIVRITIADYSVPFPALGKICGKKWALNTDFGNYTFYDVEMVDGSVKTFIEYKLHTASENDLVLYKSFIKNPFPKEKDNLEKMLEQDREPKDVAPEPAKCKYCKCEFEEDWPESKEEPGACTWCIERRDKYPKVNYRKSCNVEMKDFSGFGHDGDWLEVTEWTNGEGIDIYIHYSSDHDEDVRKFMLSYDELEVIMNIVNKFGYLPTIYTLPEEKEK